MAITALRASILTVGNSQRDCGAKSQRQLANSFVPAESPQVLISADSRAVVPQPVEGEDAVASLGSVN
jgi:hypothetical protein